MGGEREGTTTNMANGVELTGVDRVGAMVHGFPNREHKKKEEEMASTFLLFM
jgi:hypothetical protein